MHPLSTIKTCLPSRVHNILQKIYGENKHITEIGNTLSVHYSARPLHRDLYPYPLDNSAYNILSGSEHFTRIIFYLNFYGRASETIEVIPFSHRKDKYVQGCKQADIDPLGLFGINTLAKDKKMGIPPLIDPQRIEEQTASISFDTGDILIFDTRLLHAGSILNAPKYSIITTFCVEDDMCISKILSSISKANSAKKLDYYQRLYMHNFCSDTLLERIRSHIKSL